MHLGSFQGCRDQHRSAEEGQAKLAGHVPWKRASPGCSRDWVPWPPRASSTRPNRPQPSTSATSTKSHRKDSTAACMVPRWASSSSGWAGTWQAHRGHTATSPLVQSEGVIPGCDFQDESGAQFLHMSSEHLGDLLNAEVLD
jgi:hypothetical protein